VNTNDRDQLVIDHLPLVGYIVSDLCNRATHLDRDELASAGQFALFQASRSFDPERGIPFASFARIRISGALSDELRSQDWVSRGTRRKIKETLAVGEGLSASLGRNPTVDEIASALGVDRAQVDSALHHSASAPVALDELMDEVASVIVGPEESAELRERDQFLRAAVDLLPERHRLVISRIFFEDKQVKDIAEELGVSHAAVSLTRSEAIRLLHDGWIKHFDNSAGEVLELETKPATKRATYLSKLALYASPGMQTQQHASA
jgi:RNA polymerase sigma factor FliA